MIKLFVISNIVFFFHNANKIQKCVIFNTIKNSVRFALGCIFKLMGNANDVLINVNIAK